MSRKTKIKLGDEVQDTISGLTGKVIAIAYFLYGCIRVGVQPRDLKDGKPVESTYFDEPQLKLVKKSKAKKADPNHGPRENPQRTKDIQR